MEAGLKENPPYDLKQEATALGASEVRYRRLFETAQDGILILDGQSGLIIDVNPFLVNLLDYSREEFIGKTLWDIGPFRNIEASKAAFQELQDKEYIRYENLPLEARGGAASTSSLSATCTALGAHSYSRKQLRSEEG